MAAAAVSTSYMLETMGNHLPCIIGPFFYHCHSAGRDWLMDLLVDGHIFWQRILHSYFIELYESEFNGAFAGKAIMNQPTKRKSLTYMMADRITLLHE